jgi:5'-deoxynucleotidase YfbR-like HD superfamily hydrolase
MSGEWIQTFTGKRFELFAPTAEQVDVLDIAHALAHLCRFAGHTAELYTVAQHSLLVAQLLPPELRLWGLLHDGAEAYTGDFPRPLKVRLQILDEDGRVQPYYWAEQRIERAIGERYGLAWPMPAAVKRADNVALATEARDLLQGGPRHDWTRDLPPPCSGRIARCLPPAEAYRLFLDEFNRLRHAQVTAEQPLAEVTP